MVQVGTAKIDINGAVYEIPVYNYGDVDYPVIRTGVTHNSFVKGAMPFYPLNEEPTHNEVRVYHPTHGVMGLHDDATVIEIIEDWEGYSGGTLPGDTPNWHQAGSAQATIESLSAWEGSLGMTIWKGPQNGGNERVYSNATNNDGLPAYPVPGTRTEVWWQCTAQHSPEFWFGTTNQQPPGRYQLEYFWDGNFQLRCYVSDNEQWQVRSNDNPVNLSTDTWYKFVVDWDNPSRSNNIWCAIEDANGNTLGSLWTQDTTHRNGAIGFEADTGNGKTMWDYAVITERY